MDAKGAASIRSADLFQLPTSHPSTEGQLREHATTLFCDCGVMRAVCSSVVGVWWGEFGVCFAYNIRFHQEYKYDSSCVNVRKLGTRTTVLTHGDTRQGCLVVCWYCEPDKGGAAGVAQRLVL